MLYEFNSLFVFVWYYLFVEHPLGTFGVRFFLLSVRFDQFATLGKFVKKYKKNSTKEECCWIVKHLT